MLLERALRHATQVRSSLYHDVRIPPLRCRALGGSQTAPSLGVTQRRMTGRFSARYDYDPSAEGRTSLVVTP